MKLIDFIEHFEKENNIKLLPFQKKILNMMQEGKRILYIPRKIGVNTINKIFKEYKK